MNDYPSCTRFDILSTHIRLYAFDRKFDSQEEEIPEEDVLAICPGYRGVLFSDEISKYSVVASFEVDHGLRDDILTPEIRSGLSRGNHRTKIPCAELSIRYITPTLCYKGDPETLTPPDVLFLFGKSRDSNYPQLSTGFRADNNFQFTRSFLLHLPYDSERLKMSNKGYDRLRMITKMKLGALNLPNLELLVRKDGESIALRKRKD